MGSGVGILVAVGVVVPVEVVLVVVVPGVAVVLVVVVPGVAVVASVDAGFPVVLGSRVVPGSLEFSEIPG